MYTALELRTLNIKPRINDISLKILSEYYQMFLAPFIYNYHIVSKTEEKYIKLNFELENFCHLLGIESTVKNSVPFRELHNYRGKDGWNNVYNQVIDIRHLKRINRSKFNNIKAKYVYFYLLPNLIESPLCVNYDIRNVNKSTNIDCEILFYSKVDNDNAIFHLGIQEDNSGKYFPKTFFIEKVSNTGDDVFVANQQKITVTIENRIIML